MMETTANIYKSIDQELRMRREAWRLQESKLMATRNRALRALVGEQRGGITRAAKILGLSDSQIFRMLDEGITRAVTRCLDDAGVDRSDYQLTHQRGSRSIGVVLVPGSSADQDTINRSLLSSGLVIKCRQPVRNATNQELWWAALKEIKKRAGAVLQEARISSKTYRLRERRGASAVQLVFTPVVGGFVDNFSARVCEVLTQAGLTVSSGPDESIMVSDGNESQTHQETIFEWGPQETIFEWRSDEE
jgi:hypothetical protein